MKVLFVTYDFPYPLSSGGKIRAYQMIKGLAREHQITLFSYIRKEPTAEEVGEIKKYCRKIELFPRRKVWSLQHFLRAGFSLLPGTIAHYENSELRKALLEGVKRGEYDIVHFESYYASLYLPEVAALGIKTVMGNENVEYRIYKDFVEALPFYLWPLKLPLRYDLWKMRRIEEERWRRAAVNLAVSQEDAAVVEKVTGKKCYVIPNGAETELLSPVAAKSAGPPTLLFVGNLKYLQNEVGIKTFLKNTFPLIKKEVPDVVFKVVTSYQPGWLENYRGEVEIVVDEKTPFYHFASQADVMVNPVEIKGGTRIKLLEALAAGLPVVTFRSSLAGLEKLTAGRDLLVTDEPEAFAQAAVQLLGNPDLRDKIRKNGRRVVQENYNWGKSITKLLEIYSGLSHYGKT